MVEPTTKKERNADDILGEALKDTGFTKSGGFTIESETIKNIVETIQKKGYDIALSPVSVAELIKKDISKSKDIATSVQSAFNTVVQRDYTKEAEMGLRAKIRRKQGKDTGKKDDKGKKIYEGLIALCMKKKEGS